MTYPRRQNDHLPRPRAHGAQHGAGAPLRLGAAGWHLAVWLAAALSGGCGTGIENSARAGSEEESLRKKLTVLCTVSNHGYIEPCG